MSEASGLEEEEIKTIKDSSINSEPSDDVRALSEAEKPSVQHAIKVILNSRTRQEQADKEAQNSTVEKQDKQERHLHHNKWARILVVAIIRDIRSRIRMDLISKLEHGMNTYTETTREKADTPAIVPSSTLLVPAVPDVQTDLILSQITTSGNTDFTSSKNA